MPAGRDAIARSTGRARALGPRRPRATRRVVVVLLLGLVAGLGAGCVRVKPYQRGTLASPVMQFQVDPYAEAQERSMREILEAGTFSGGGPGGAGGGCGCK